MKFGALILAAGYSSRMSGFKPLLTLGGKTLLAHCADRFRIAGVEDIVVVTGHRAEDVGAEAHALGLRPVHNRDYDQGMFSSVLAGIQQLQRCDGFWLLPVDIPLVHPATLVQLAAGFDGRAVLMPKFAGLQGHPPLIPWTLIPSILDHDGQGGLRGFLACQQVCEVAVWDRGILLDADTPEAFAALQVRFDALAAGEMETEEAMMMAGLGMGERGVAHGRAVAAIAVALGRELNNYGYALSCSLLHNGGLLHDIAKGEPDHEAAGGRLLADLGFTQLAAIVAAHRSVVPPADGRLTEKELVCLADKLVRGTTRLSVRQRFEEKLRQYADDPAAVAAINRRLDEILRLQELVETQTGAVIEAITAGAVMP